MKTARNLDTNRPPQKQSVLIIGGCLGQGAGVNRVICDLSAILHDRLGFEVTVLSRTDVQPSYKFSAGVKLEFRPDAFRLPGFFRVIWEMRRRNYDHVVGFWFDDNIRLAIAFFGQKRLILTEHTSWFHAPFTKRVARALLYRTARAVVVLNEADHRHYQNYLNNVVLIPNPVPKLRLSKEVKREKLILAVGHLIDRKNFAEAVRAVARSNLDAEGWSLAIVGVGPEKSKLERLIAELRLQNARIHDPTENIESWYTRASFLLVTSKIEVFSMVLAEAMRSGVLPLAFAADGPAFILKDHPELLVPIGDSAALGDRLRDLAHAHDLPQRRLMMEAIIQDRFSEELVADHWKKLLSGEPRTHP